MLTEQEIKLLAMFRPPEHFMNPGTRSSSGFNRTWDDICYQIGQITSFQGDRYNRIEETLNSLSDSFALFPGTIEQLKEINEKNRNSVNEIDNNVLKSLAQLNSRYACHKMLDQFAIKIEIPDITLRYRGGIAEFRECWLELYLDRLCPDNIRFGYERGPRRGESSQHPHASGNSICYGSGLPHAQALSNLKRYDLLIDRFVLPVLNSFSAGNPYLSFGHYVTARVEPRQTCPKCKRVALVSNAVMYQENEDSERFFYHPACYGRAMRDNLLPPPQENVEPAPQSDIAPPAEESADGNQSNIPISAIVPDRETSASVVFTTNINPDFFRSSRIFPTWQAFSLTNEIAEQSISGTDESLEQQIAQEALESSEVPF